MVLSTFSHSWITPEVPTTPTDIVERASGSKPARGDVVLGSLPVA